jgi:triosephosphate isomerase
MMTPLVVGNWKANGLQVECRELARALARGIMRKAAAVEVALAPPYTGL